MLKFAAFPSFSSLIEEIRQEFNADLNGYQDQFQLELQKTNVTIKDSVKISENTLAGFSEKVDEYHYRLSGVQSILDQLTIKVTLTQNDVSSELACYCKLKD